MAQTFSIISNKKLRIPLTQKSCHHSEILRQGKHFKLQVNNTVLLLVGAYLEYHSDKKIQVIAMPLRSTHCKKFISDKWDVRFIKSVGANKKDLFDVIRVAKELKIEPLKHLTCAFVASILKNKPISQIKKILTCDL